jgi:hypothetical protein
VLIAAAIAAAMISATAQMLGGSARLSRETAARSDTLLAAQTIVARLQSGMDDDEALEGFDGWRIARHAYPREQANAEPFFDRVSVEQAGGSNFRLEILIKRRAGNN